MSKRAIKISPDLYDIMPSDYRIWSRCDLWQRPWVERHPRHIKELIEQHSLCAGCPESMAFRYILASPLILRTRSW